MAEMIYTVASIGGRITRKHAQEIADIVDVEFDDMYNEDTSLNMILDAAAKGDHVTFAGQVNFGEPDELRAYLRRKRLPHVVTYNAGGEFNAGGYVSRAGKDRFFEADNEGDPVVSLVTLKKAAGEGQGLKSLIRSIEACRHENVPAVVLKD
jgi:hypothetical protein